MSKKRFTTLLREGDTVTTSANHHSRMSKALREHLLLTDALKVSEQDRDMYRNRWQTSEETYKKLEEQFRLLEEEVKHLRAEKAVAK